MNNRLNAQPKPKPEGDEYMLATTCFVLSSRRNRDAIVWRREAFLQEKTASGERVRACCMGLRGKGDAYAVGIGTSYCTRCYGWMVEPELSETSPARTYPPAETSPLLMAAQSTGQKYGLTGGREIRHEVEGHTQSMTDGRG